MINTNQTTRKTTRKTYAERLAARKAKRLQPVSAQTRRAIQRRVGMHADRMTRIYAMDAGDVAQEMN